ncbi:MAG: hypothetical protein GC182_08445 [Rhodopseudomonas sp.]|nr:hypothetical protein [Rhodopseudomonas sp.]
MLTKDHKKIIMAAVAETRDRWEQSARNYGVMARADDGAWDIPPGEAGRKLARINRRIKSLDAAMLRLATQ